MNLTARAHNPHVTLLHVQGNVDGETYGHLLVEAQQLLARGTRCLVLELSDCEYMSSAGLMALSSIFKQMRDLTRNESSASWVTQNTLDRAGELGPMRQLVLVAPCAEVLRVLNLAGMQAYLGIFPDVTSALEACVESKLVT